MGKLEEAVADYDRALALRPFNTEDICNRAGVLADIGRFDEAVAGFDRALALMPEMAPAYYNRGNLYTAGRTAGQRAGRFRQGARDRAATWREPHAGRGRALEALQREATRPRQASPARRSIDPKYAELGGRSGTKHERVEHARSRLHLGETVGAALQRQLVAAPEIHVPVLVDMRRGPRLVDREARRPRARAPAAPSR